MGKALGAMLAVAAGIMVQGVVANSAMAFPNLKQSGVASSNVEQVRHRGGSHFHGGRSFNRGFHGTRSFHTSRSYYRGNHFRGGRYGYYNRPFYRYPRYRHRYWGGAYFYNNYAGGSCYWLKRRALNTGSSYWWHRYNRCRNGW